MAEGSWIRIGSIKAGLDATTVNSIIEKALGKRLQSITNAPDVRQKIGEAFVEAVTPLVPVSKEEKAHHLYQSGRATDDGRVYWTAINSRGQNYAGYVYDPDETRWPDGKYSHSDTTHKYPRWVEHMKPGAPEYAVFLNKVREIIIAAHNGGQI